MEEAERQILLQVFAAESEENFAEIETGLLRLEAQPDDMEIVHAIFRAAHTLKGNAGSLGFVEAAQLAHGLEDLLDPLRKKTAAVTPAVIGELLRAFDALRQQLVGKKTEEEATEGPVTDALLQGSRTLRIDAARLDDMLDGLGEIAGSRARLAAILERLGPAGNSALEQHRDAERLYHDLERLILRARMLPLAFAFRPLERIVRDLSIAQGKRVQLLIRGADVEVDTRIVEHLRAPLTHLVRNAIDHGVERPAARLAFGKPAEAVIELSARHVSGGVVVECRDDGAGLDRDAIRARASERGFLTDPERASDADLDRIIFEPGFSTAATVTEVSGRGVGMDVVKKRIEEVGGRVEIASEPGRGTTITLRMPLTMAILEACAVEVSGDVFLIPMASVRECITLVSQEGTPAADRSAHSMIEYRGAAVPSVRLRRALGMKGQRPARETVVIVEHEGQLIALVVDEVLGIVQAIIKSIGRLLQGVPAVAGSSIWQNSQVALILDLPSLLTGLQQSALLAPKSGQSKEQMRWT